MGMQHLTITLPDEIAERVRAKVASGEYASENDVIQDGVERLVCTRDEAFQSWLKNEVGPAYDKMRADPSRALTVDQVRASIRTLHQE